MKAELFKPGPALSKYIDNYMLVDVDWRNTAAPANVWRLIPYGKVSMLFLYAPQRENPCLAPCQVPHHFEIESESRI